MNTTHQVIIGFQTAMQSYGITPPDNLIGDGKLHRAHVDGDKSGTKNLAYVLHIDHKPSGWFMHYKTGVSSTWTASGKKQPMSLELKRQIEYAREARQKEIAEAQTKAAEKAIWIWNNAKPVDVHPYLESKRIKPHGLKTYKGVLVIPLVDESGVILSLQFINADGTKRFLSGGRKKGCYATIGDPTDTILICEGWATSASLHEATGHHVIAAMDAGNLESVARTIRDKYPEAKIILCADNDKVGLEKATVAAFACNGLMIAPPDEGTDFNDFICAVGVVHG